MFVVDPPGGAGRGRRRCASMKSRRASIIQAIGRWAARRPRNSNSMSGRSPAGRSAATSRHGAEVEMENLIGEEVFGFEQYSARAGIEPSALRQDGSAARPQDGPCHAHRAGEAGLKRRAFSRPTMGRSSGQRGLMLLFAYPSRLRRFFAPDVPFHHCQSGSSRFKRWLDAHSRTHACKFSFATIMSIRPSRR